MTIVSRNRGRDNISLTCCPRRVTGQSTQHANFIINTGGATADEVVQLISYIKQQVRDKLGIQLMEEVEYIGF